MRAKGSSILGSKTLGKTKTLNSRLSRNPLAPIKNKTPNSQIKNDLKKRRLKLSIGLEANIQIMLCEYINLQYKCLRGHVVKINNEGNQSRMAGGLAKMMGLLAGASDLFIAWPMRRDAGLWLEIKADNIKRTKSNAEHWDRQLAFIDRMRAVGYAAHMGIGFDECKRIIDEYLSEK